MPRIARRGPKQEEFICLPPEEEVKNRFMNAQEYAQVVLNQLEPFSLPSGRYETTANYISRNNTPDEVREVPSRPRTQRDMARDSITASEVLARQNFRVNYR